MNILTRPGRSVFKPAMLVSSVALALALAGCNGGAGGAGGGGGGATVATVNGESIGREDLHNYLESTAGDNALRQLINNQLVLQAAKKENLEVTDDDVNKFIEERRKQNPAVSAQLDEILKTGGLRADALKRQVRYQLAIEKLVTKNIKVDESALEKWFAANKKNYGTPASAKISLLTSSTKARVEAMAQQLKSKTKTFPQLIDDQKKANDPVAKESGADKDLPVDNLPPALKGQIDKLKPNEISGVITLGPGVYGVIRLESRVEAKTPTLAEIRPQVEREYKQEQLARETVKKNPQNPGFDATIQQVQQMIATQNMQQGNMSQPTKTDAYQFINQTEIQNLMAKLASEAKVEFTDTAYSRLGEEFKKSQAGVQPSGAAPSGAPAPAPADGHGPNDGHGH